MDNFFPEFPPIGNWEEIGGATPIFPRFSAESNAQINGQIKIYHLIMRTAEVPAIPVPFPSR
jgi:hypothetical protein